MASALSASRSTPCFRVWLLGTFALERESVPVDVDRWQPRVVTLFKLLATAPDRRRSRDELIDILWPDATPDVGGGNLRMVLHRLRRSLPDDPSPIVSDHGWIALNPAYDWEVDLESFARLTSEDDMTALEEAAGLYRGEVLVENRYDDWAAPIREAVQRRWNAVCLRLARNYRTRGSQEDAAQWLERLLQSEPLHEQALQELLSILDDLGRRAEALRRYRQFEQILSEEMDVPPEPETLALVARLEGYLRGAGPAARDGRHTRILPVIPRYTLMATGPFVGRGVELAEILSALPPGRTGAPRLVMIAAEAGIGKTRLLAEIAWRARDMGALTLAGGCYEQESTLPYGPIHDALADYIRTQPESVLRAQLESTLSTIPATTSSWSISQLSQIVPEVRSRLGSGEQTALSDAADHRLALFAAVNQVFERISQDTPLVLLLDDLHWADDATLQLLHFLLRQPALDRMLIVGTYRQEEVSLNEPLLRLCTAIEQQNRDISRARIVALGPLEEGDVGTLLEARVRSRCARSLVRNLHGRSGGNPFFAGQMLRLLQQEKLLDVGEDGLQLTSGAAIELPREVRETVARRLHRLGPDDQEVLRLAAVLGREISFPALEALWGGNNRSLFAALDTAQVSYVLDETEGGYVFRHPLLRDVIYNRTPEWRRMQLHRRVGTILEDLYGDRRGEHAAELAWHSLHGGNREQALRYSVLAAEQAASRCAYATAEQHYWTALDLVEDARDAADSLDIGDVQAGPAPAVPLLQEKLGALLKTAGRYGEAIGLLQTAVEGYAALTDIEGQRRALAHIGRVHLARGTVEEGLTQLSAALQRLGGEPSSPALAALQLSLAFLLFRHGRYAEQLDAAGRAAEMARTYGEWQLAAEAELVRAYALPFVGPVGEDTRDFGAALEDVVRSAEEIGDWATVSRALCALGPHQAEKGELSVAQRNLSRALELAERLGDRSRIAFVLSTCGLVAFWRGEWDQAQTYFGRSLALYRELDAISDALSPLYGLGALAMARGEWETGKHYLEEHTAEARSVGDFRWLHLVCLLFAERDLLEGNPQSARKRIEEFRALPGLSADALLEILPTLACAFLAMGDVAGAESIAAEAVQQASAADAGMILPEALRAHGSALAAEGRWEEAEQDIQEALTRSRSIACPYVTARVLGEYGAMLVEEGSLEQARLQLEEALSIYRRLSARPSVARVEGALMGMHRS